MTTLSQKTVGSYRLGRLLGSGGMADVYGSLDLRTGEEVAVKVFRDTCLGGTDRRGAEVRTLTALRHPNLVELLDAGTHDGREFLVMTLVEGPTLGEACHDQRLPLARTAQIGAAVADALAYVHAGDVVHRDVKPDNVLLGPGSRVRLADFGIARMISATRITRSGLIVGTAGYLAPEQVRGGDVATAADVYALGLVLLECLTGHPEYQGTAVESALARLYRRPHLPAELPTGWAALLDAMTATDWAARPPASSAAAALHELAAAPRTGVAALEQAIGAPFGVPAAAAPEVAAGAVAAEAVAPEGVAAEGVAPGAYPSQRIDVGSSGGWSRRRRVLASAAAAMVVLTPIGIVGAGALVSDGSQTQATASTHRSAGADVFTLPFTKTHDVKATTTAHRQPEATPTQQGAPPRPAALVRPAPDAPSPPLPTAAGVSSGPAAGTDGTGSSSAGSSPASTGPDTAGTSRYAAGSGSTPSTGSGSGGTTSLSGGYSSGSAAGSPGPAQSGGTGVSPGTARPSSGTTSTATSPGVMPGADTSSSPATGASQRPALGSGNSSGGSVSSTAHRSGGGSGTSRGSSNGHHKR